MKMWKDFQRSLQQSYCGYGEQNVLLQTSTETPPTP